MILLCDGTSAAESPKAIQHLCSFAGQLGPQKARLHVPPAFLRVDAGRTLFAFRTLQKDSPSEHGVIGYSVSEGTREIGLRMALGAKRSDVLRLVLRQSMTLATAGVLLGLAGSAALTRVLRTLLFGVNSTDPFTFIGITLLLAAVAFLACYLPARRAARVEPMEALRYE